MSVRYDDCDRNVHTHMYCIVSEWMGLGVNSLFSCTDMLVRSQGDGSLSRTVQVIILGKSQAAVGDIL